MSDSRNNNGKSFWAESKEFIKEMISLELFEIILEGISSLAVFIRRAIIIIFIVFGAIGLVLGILNNHDENQSSSHAVISEP